MPVLRYRAMVNGVSAPGLASREISSFSDRLATLGRPAHPQPSRHFPDGPQSANANDRVIGVLWKLVAHGGANFLIGFTLVNIGGRDTPPRSNCSFFYEQHARRIQLDPNHYPVLSWEL
ncbi:MAG: hypothetical protein ACM3IH_16150 [Sphingobacteriales bacterium]